MSRDLKALILRNAIFYGESLPDMVISMHADALSDLPYELIEKAYIQLTRQAKVRKMPLPAEVRELIQPQEDRELDDANNARAAAARILAAISKYGHVNFEQAKDFIGELGWEVVKLQGGWDRICTITEDEIPTLQAQWRDLAKSLIRSSRRGTLHEKPKLPGAIADLLKLPAMPQS